MACSVHVAFADLCLRARQLGLLGEAVAAEQLLAERQFQASHTLTAAADTGSAADLPLLRPLDAPLLEAAQVPLPVPLPLPGGLPRLFGTSGIASDPGADAIPASCLGI